MGELPSRESLEMSLLLFTLISTALVTPTRWDARCLRSALLRETSAHSSVHMSSTPPAEAAAESCMPWSPVDCGEGMKSCPGNFDHRACPMPDICIAEGDECPYVCPPLKHPHCGFAMSNCAGPVDAMGCETPMNCIMVDWAAGETCPPPAEAVAANCGPWTIADCGDGKGMKSCPGELDAR